MAVKSLSIRIDEEMLNKLQTIFQRYHFQTVGKQIQSGIDLNLQFPAGWEQAREIKFAQGFNKPAPRDFVGYGPLTAPEAVALYTFTLRHNFSIMLTYHTQGRVIFYQYQNHIQ